MHGFNLLENITHYHINMPLYQPQSVPFWVNPPNEEASHAVTFLSRNFACTLLQQQAIVFFYTSLFSAHSFSMSQSLSSADWSGVSSTLWFGSLLRGLRAMKLVVGAMETHPVMGWLQRNWGCTLGRTPPLSPPSHHSLFAALPPK